MSEAKMRAPLPNGTVYDGTTIEECIQCDQHDDYQPYLYMLSNGDTVWIPVDYQPAIAKAEAANRGDRT